MMCVSVYVRAQERYQVGEREEAERERERDSNHLTSI